VDTKKRAVLVIENCAHPTFKPALEEYFERARKDSPGQHTPHILDEAFTYLQSWRANHEAREAWREDGIVQPSACKRP
jgi:succinyl-CoA:acetate CoA-transferase